MKVMSKIRLDAAVFQAGMTESREKARAVIMAGDVFVNNQKVDKPGTPVDPDSDTIELRANSLRYVSRGGLKLEKAMTAFSLTLDGKICADVGASTGGFSDCMLQNGAQKIYAIDVGYGQLAWKLRCDPHIINLERTNFRYVTKEQVPDALDFASVDVSFISLRLILPVLHTLLKEDGEAVCLIKPQFEAGRDKVGKHGVVKDPDTHLEVVQNVTTFMLEIGFSVIGLDYSPIKGPQGNIEYLAFIRKNDTPTYAAARPEDVVARSHAALSE